MSALNLDLPDAFWELPQPARFKAYYGGRGSGKSHTFAAHLVVMAFQKPLRVLCCREVQNSIQDSVKQLLDDKIREIGLSDFYTSTKSEIVGKNGSRFSFAGLRSNPEAKKSMEGINILWVEEADTISQDSLDKMIPTIRQEGSEIWFSWNPRSEFDPVDRMFRGRVQPPRSIIRRVSYKDNPWFPDVLREAMEHDRATDPEKAAHVWDGDYQSAPKGAYFAELLAKALSEGRIGNVPHDPMLQTYVSVDLGNGPNMALWFAQWVGREIRVIDYLQGDEVARSEGWPWYIRKIRAKGYDIAEIILPHDARPAQRYNGKGDDQTVREAGFSTRIVEKMARGEREKLVQRYLPLCYFDEGKCGPEGIFALKNHQPDYDEKMRVDRGPLHNWASHPADSFGHMIQAYEEPSIPREEERVHHGAGGWMS